MSHQKGTTDVLVNTLSAEASDVTASSPTETADNSFGSNTSTVIPLVENLSESNDNIVLLVENPFGSHQNTAIPSAENPSGSNENIGFSLVKHLTGSHDNIGVPLVENLPGNNDSIAVTLTENMSGSNDSISVPLVENPSGSTDIIAVPLVENPSRCNDSIAVPLVENQSGSNDSIAVPLVENQSGSNDNIAVPFVENPSGSNENIAAPLVEKLSGRSDNIAVSLVENPSGSTDNINVPLVEHPSGSTDIIAVPLVENQSGSNDNIAVPLVENQSGSNDNIAVPLVENPSGSNESIAVPLVEKLSGRSDNIAVSLVENLSGSNDNINVPLVEYPSGSNGNVNVPLVENPSESTGNENVNVPLVENPSGSNTNITAPLAEDTSTPTRKDSINDTLATNTPGSNVPVPFIELSSRSKTSTDNPLVTNLLGNNDSISKPKKENPSKINTTRVSTLFQNPIGSDKARLNKPIKEDPPSTKAKIPTQTKKTFNPRENYFRSTVPLPGPLHEQKSENRYQSDPSSRDSSTSFTAPWIRDGGGDRPAIFDCITDNTRNQQSMSNDPKCDFCAHTSLWSCSTCYNYYCIQCVNQLHPTIGAFTTHLLEPVLFSPRLHLCLSHRGPARHRCNTCEEWRCADCLILDEQCRHHDVELVVKDLRKVKTDMLKTLEIVSNGSIASIHRQNLGEDKAKLELALLLRKEEVRQEFVSFHDFLIEAESDIMGCLDKEYNDRRNYLDLLEDMQVTSDNTPDKPDNLPKNMNVSRKMRDMASSVTSIAQQTTRSSFMKKYAERQDLCKQVAKETRAEYDASLPPTILGYSFSMSKEKLDLRTRLCWWKGSFRESGEEIGFQQKTVFVKATRPFPLHEYLGSFTLPTSTTCICSVELKHRPNTVWSTCTDSIESLCLNNSTTYQFTPGQSYLLKIQPHYSIQMSAITERTVLGRPSHMMICVEDEIPFPDTVYFLGGLTSYEEQRQYYRQRKVELDFNGSGSLTQMIQYSSDEKRDLRAPCDSGRFHSSRTAVTIPSGLKRTQDGKKRTYGDDSS